MASRYQHVNAKPQKTASFAPLGKQFSRKVVNGLALAGKTIFARKLTAAERLEATRKPNPDYVRRRLSHLSPERRERWIMSAGVHSPELFS